MRTLAPLTIAVNTAQAIDIDNTVTGLVIANESNFSLQVTAGAYAKWIPAWTVDFLDTSDTPTLGIASIMPYAVLSSTASPPASSVLVTLLARGDTLSGTYPYSLTRQVTASAVTQSALNLLAPDELQGLYLDDTDIPGVLAVIPTQEPAATGVLELGLTRRVDATHVAVFLQSDNTTSVPTARAKLPFCFSIDAGTYVKGVQIILGSGAGVVNHTLGVTPKAVILCPTQVAEAFSVGGYTSTQFTVSGITLSHQWVALVIAA